jgi:hypothetical protein
MADLTDMQVAELAREMQAAGEAANKVRLTRRELRQRKLDPTLPPGWSKNVHIKHKTAEIDDAVTVLRNRLVAAPISILVFAKSGEAEAQESASRVRRFLKKVWLDLNSGYPSAHFNGTDSQVADGCWAAHVTWDQDWIDAALKAPDIDEFLRRTGLPFTLETPDLLNVYLDFDRKERPTRVVTIERIFVRDLVNKAYQDSDGSQYWLDYDTSNKDLTKSSEPRTYDNLWESSFGEMVTMASFEDSDFVHRVVLEGPEEGKKRDYGLGKWPNLFGRPAWVFIPGDFSNSTDPLERWKPLVLNMYSIGQEVNMIRSARVNLGTMMGLPRIGFEKTEDKGFGPVGQEPKPELTFNEDGTYMVTPGWKLTKFEFPADAANSLDKAEASMEMEMARYRPPAALVGRREEGVSSGYQQSLVADAAMTHLDPPLKLQSQGIRDILSLVLDGAKAIKKLTASQVDRLYVRNLREYRTDGRREAEVLELKIDDIDDYEITVRQSSMSPSSRIAAIEEGRRARAAGEIDDIELYEEFYGYEDGVEMQRRATEQKMYDSLIDEAISTARAIIQQKIAARTPTPPTILGPTGMPISGPGVPQQPGLAGLPLGAARPGLDATLAQPAPPGPQPAPVGPTGGQTGLGSRV